MMRVGFATAQLRHQLFRAGMLGMQTGYDDSKDQVIAAGLPHEEPSSIMLVRPMIWVHGLQVNPQYPQRIRARAVEAMLNYSLGWGPAAPRLICGSIFQVDPRNDKMGAVATSLGAVEEANAHVYRIDL